MGKGSGRRPLKVNKEKFDQSWDNIFGNVVPQKQFKTLVKVFSEGDYCPNKVMATVAGFEGDMQCDVSLTTSIDTHYTASLENLIASGKLECRTEGDNNVITYTLDRDVINEITTWALYYVTLKSLGLESVDVFEEVGDE